MVKKVQENTMLAMSGRLGSVTEQPFEQIAGLDEPTYLYGCDTVYAVNRFFITECGKNMTKADIDTAHDFISYQDTILIRPDLVSLDNLLYEMVVTGQSCTTLQGAHCG